MITGVKKVTLTTEAILRRISEYDIFRYYMPNTQWKPNDATISPFPRSDGRIENNPSFVIGNKHGNLSFIDFTDTSLRGDCFTFVKLLLHIPTLDEVLKTIDRDFGLGISTGQVGNYKKIVGQYQQPEDLGKRYSLVQVSTRQFTHNELAYWNLYYQDIEDLRANHIYSIKELYLNKKRFPLNDNELRFGYLYDGYWKIYRPFADKRSKWVPNNVPLNMMRGLDNLNKEYNSLILDSLKDYMVCRKIYEYVAHSQNESLAAFSHENIAYIKENSKEVFYGGDSDAPGKQASYAITSAFGFKHINPPDNLLPSVKDWAGWGKDRGLKELENHFIKKGLYG